MKKMIKYALSILIACSTMIALPQKEVEAISSSYSFSCGGQYEVALANDSGGFTSIGCYGDFYTAKSVMWDNGDDAVVRHNGSYSPTGIIAVNSGVAITYPMRSDSSTLNVYSQMYQGGKSTYVTKHREMSSPITETYNGSGDGEVYVMFNGFEGYTSLKNLDLVPMKFVTNNLSIQLGGNDITSNNEQPFWNTVKQSNYTVVQNGNYKDLVYNAYSGYNSAAYTFIVGPAADWMSVGSTYYSWDNTTFYSDRNYRNSVGTYYNYYQFLPVRSQSEIPSSAYNNFLSSMGYNSKPSSTSLNALGRNQSQLWDEGQSFIDAQNTYGVNALLIFSMACLESAYGRSRYAVERNNLFGWNAFDSNPDSASYFPSISQAVQEHMGINLRGYADITDYRFFGSHVGNKGSGFNVKYASDPYWGAKIASIAYSIDKHANGNNGQLTDFNKYSLGLINTYDTSVKQSASSSSKTLYTTTYGNSYQKNFTVVMNSQDSSWTQIQSTNGLYADGSLIVHKVNGNTNALIPYDFNLSVGYLPTSQLTPLNTTQVIVPEGTTPVGDFKQEITDFEMVNGSITLFGSAYQPGIYVNDYLNDLTHYLILDDGKETKEILLNQLYDAKENYAAAGFAGFSIDLTDLALGTYQLSIKTVHKDYEETRVITNITSSSNQFNSKNYELKSDSAKTTITISRDEIAEKYVTLLNNISLNEEGLISVDGIAFVEGKDNSKENISHRLDIISLASNKVINSVDLISTTGAYDLSDGYNHGLDYSYGWYEGTVDTTDLDYGEYMMNIVTTVEGKEYTSVFNGLDKISDSGIKNINGKYVQILKQNNYLNRFEIHVKNYEIELDKNIPTYLEAYNYLAVERFISDSNELGIKGTGYIRKGSFSSNDKVKYTLYMINDESGQIQSFESEGLAKLNDNDASWDNTAEQTTTTKYNYDNTWYEFKIPLNGLSDGTYSYKLKIETKDYVELVDIKDSATRIYTDYDKDVKVLGLKDKVNKNIFKHQISGFNVLLDSIESDSQEDTDIELDNSTNTN